MAIERAENFSPQDVVQSRVNKGEASFLGKSFFDETREVLHVGIEKEGDFKDDVKALIEFKTEDSQFPATSMLSSMIGKDNNEQDEWRKFTKLSQVMRSSKRRLKNSLEQKEPSGDKFFRMEVRCPEKECYFAIPTVI
mmetsp:Transcript_10691/g.16270  ORF Transcript_10691/g.16270 Transcript_10691/m.16270 type:complete len:138 (-) Transcript_10691:2-415(-)